MTMEEYYAHEIAGAREDGWDEGFADGKDEGLAEGLKNGEMQGKAAGEARMSNLTKLLLTAQRADDLLRATEDAAYREELFKEFGL